MVLLPFAKLFLPSRRESPDFAADEAADASLSVHPFLEPVGRHTGEFPKAGAVRDKWPKSPLEAWPSEPPGGSGRLPSFDRVATLAGIGGSGHSLSENHCSGMPINGLFLG
jgi:hypothetical protein